MARGKQKIFGKDVFYPAGKEKNYFPDLTFSI